MIVAGIAVIMMYFYHFFAFPDLQPSHSSYWTLFVHLSTPIEQIVAPFGQLCVAIFAFNTGYAIGVTPNKFSSYKVVGTRLIKFLLGYWIVCLLFYTYAAFFDVPFPDAKTLICNLFGFKLSARADFINVSHGWYVSYYIILLLMLPIIKTAGLHNRIVTLTVLYIVFVIGMPFLPSSVLIVLWPITSSLTGYLVCKYNILGALINIKTATMRVILSFQFIIVAFCLRHFLSGCNAWGRLDGIYALLIISSVLMILPLMNKSLKQLLATVGALGVFYWFLHSCFVIPDNKMVNLLYMPYIPPLILVWGLLLMTLPAMGCKKLQSKVYSSIQHLNTKLKS